MIFRKKSKPIHINNERVGIQMEFFKEGEVTMVGVTRRRGESMGEAVVRTFKALMEEKHTDVGEYTGEPCVGRPTTCSPSTNPLQNMPITDFSKYANTPVAKQTEPFSVALAQLKKGRKVARLGWNGKDQYVTLIPAGNAFFQGYDMQDCLGLKNAQGEMQPGWCPSQGDLFAEDWVLLD